MKGVRRYVVGGLLLYVISLAALAPASLFGTLVTRYASDRIVLTQSQGTIWHGSAAMWVGNRDAARKLGILQWRINPLWLLTGKVHAHLSLVESGLTLDSTVMVGFGSFRLAATQAAIPVEVISLFYSPAELLRLDGQLRVQSDSLGVGKGDVSGNLDLWIDHVSSRLSTVSPLGSYRLNASGSGNKLRLDLTTVSGDLGLAGQGEWQPETGNLRFEGAARPLAHADELEPLLQILGPDRGKGQRSLVAKLRLPL